MTSWQGANLESIANELKNIREILEKRSTNEKSSMAGEWIINEPEESGYGTIYECPYCKYEVEFVQTNYCPNCGADMRGEEE